MVVCMLNKKYIKLIIKCQYFSTCVSSIKSTLFKIYISEDKWCYKDQIQKQISVILKPVETKNEISFVMTIQVIICS